MEEDFELPVVLMNNKTESETPREGFFYGCQGFQLSVTMLEGIAKQ